MNAASKTALMTAGAVIAGLFLINNFGPTKRLLSGDVSVQEAVTRDFWAGRR